MFRRKETKRAFGQAIRDGKSKTYHGSHIRYAPRQAKAGLVVTMSEEEKHWFPDIWAEMIAQCGPVQEPEPDCPGRKMSPEVEASICRQMRIYKRCSRNCKPRAFGGCKGYNFWPSCPQPEPSEE